MDAGVGHESPALSTELKDAAQYMAARLCHKQNGGGLNVFSWDSGINAQQKLPP